jgi:hypothetical protein
MNEISGAVNLPQAGQDLIIAEQNTLASPDKEHHAVARKLLGEHIEAPHHICCHGLEALYIYPRTRGLPARRFRKSCACMMSSRRGTGRWRFALTRRTAAATSVVWQAFASWVAASNASISTPWVKGSSKRMGS